jgi:hypothetical protein
VVSWWHGTQLALALDATALGTRFVVLAVSVVYRNRTGSENGNHAAACAC